MTCAGRKTSPSVVATTSRASWAQQVGEKALKALLYGSGVELVRTHSVAQLCAEGAAHDAELIERGQRWSILDGFYVSTRYPNALPDSIPSRVYTRDAANEAVRLACEIVDYVRGRLI